MMTVADRREADAQLVELTRSVAELESNDELALECPYCGHELDESGFCPFDGATALGGLPEPR